MAIRKANKKDIPTPVKPNIDVDKYEDIIVDSSKLTIIQAIADKINEYGKIYTGLNVSRKAGMLVYRGGFVPFTYKQTVDSLVMNLKAKAAPTALTHTTTAVSNFYLNIHCIDDKNTSVDINAYNGDHVLISDSRIIVVTYNETVCNEYCFDFYSKED